MLRIGSEINGYTVIGAWLMQKADRPDHVVILGHDQYRAHGHEFVVAGVSTDAEPTQWDFGSYTGDGAKAFADFLRRTELSSLLPEATGPDEAEAPAATTQPERQALDYAHIELDITFDNQKTEHPANWNWTALLDLGAGESVMVVAD